MAGERDLISELSGLWYTFLKKYNVRFPTSKIRKLQLMCLFEHYPNSVSQDKMEDWIRKKGGKNDRQARHLAWDGWYIQTGNRSSSRMEVNPNLANDELLLASWETPNPIWQNHHKKMSEIEKKHSGFGKILRKYKSRGCFVCGMKGDTYLPYSDYKFEKYQFDVIPLCVECNYWCESKNIKLEVSDNLVARPFIEENITSQKFNSINNGSNSTKKAITECGHTIKVTAVKKIGGPMQGQWAILIWGPKVIGKRGKKTLYSSPNINNVKHKLSKFLGNYEIISPESGLSSILPISNTDS